MRALTDTWTMAKRSLRHTTRSLDTIITVVLTPIAMLLLFVYVFGGAIQTPGFDYVDFLMPGIIAQSIAFGGFVTALGLSEDVQKGLIDRFRSLPMSRAAVLTGRTFSDILLNCLSLVVLFAVGFVAGFNFVSASVGEIALELAALLDQRGNTRRHVLEAGAQFRSRGLRGLDAGVRRVACRVAGQRLDAAHVRGARALRDDLEQPDLRADADVRAAA